MTIKQKRMRKPIIHKEKVLTVVKLSTYLICKSMIKTKKISRKCSHKTQQFKIQLLSENIKVVETKLVIYRAVK